MDLTIDKRNRVFEENINLIHSVVHKMVNTVKLKSQDDILYTYEDLFQIGSIALIKAIELFKEEKDVRFSTYAVSAIKNSILRELQRVDRKKRKKNAFELSIDEPTLSQYLSYEEDFLPDEPLNDLIGVLEKGKGDKLHDKEMEMVTLLLLGYKKRDIMAELKLNPTEYLNCRRKIVKAANKIKSS